MFNKIITDVPYKEIDKAKKCSERVETCKEVPVRDGRRECGKYFTNSGAPNRMCRCKKKKLGSGCVKKCGVDAICTENMNESTPRQQQQKQQQKQQQQKQQQQQQQKQSSSSSRSRSK